MYTRGALFFLAAILLALGAAPPTKPHAADANAKEWEKMEQELAEMDRLFEKEDWAVERKKANAEFAKTLRKADRIDVFRLNSRPLAEKRKVGKRAFHGYEIRIEGEIDTEKRRKEVAVFVGKILHWNDFRRGLCFNPRHGVRMFCGKRTLDFLICFECFRVEVFEDEKALESFALSRLKDNPIEAVLRELEMKSTDRR